MENLNFATRWNIDEVEANYLKWLNEPNALDPNWRVFFEGFHLGSENLDVSSVSVASSDDKKHGTIAVAGDDTFEKTGKRGFETALLGGLERLKNKENISTPKVGIYLHAYNNDYQDSIDEIFDLEKSLTELNGYAPVIIVGFS